MTKPASLDSQKKRIVFGTTVGMSAMALLRGQMAWFREQGWDVTLVTSPDAEAKRAAKRENISLFGIPMKRNISLLNDLKSSVNWIRLIRRVRPHVINVGTPKASLLGMMAAWVCRVPRRIYTVRGLRLEGTHGVMGKLLWLMERATLGMATDVIAVSASLGKELVYRKLASPEDVWIIGSGSSNGVDASAIQNRVSQIDRDHLRRQLGIKPTSFVVGYIGRVNTAKGVETLLSAIHGGKILDRVELLLVGPLEDSRFDEWFEEIHDRTHLVPWTEDVWKYLPAMDLLCLPTLREGFPNTVIEAAAASVPAITTRATGAIDSVIDGETGYLIDIADVETLVRRVNLLARDPKLLARLGANAKHRVENEFEPQRIWNGIQAIAEGRTALKQLKRLNQYIESRESE